MTLPQDPGEASLKGQVSIKNTKGEPVACVALDIQAPPLAGRWSTGRFCMNIANRNHRWERWDPGKNMLKRRIVQTKSDKTITQFS